MSRVRLPTIGTLLIVSVAAGCGGVGLGRTSGQTPEPVVATSAEETGWWSIVVVTGGDDPGEDPPVPKGQADPPTVTIQIPADVLFDSGSHVVLQSERSRLAEWAASLVQWDQPITVVGHTDSVGQDSDNLRLGANRAAAVAELLVDSGVPPTLIVGTESAGERCPVADNATPAGRAENRRVELLLSRPWTGCQAAD